MRFNKFCFLFRAVSLSVLLALLLGIKPAISASGKIFNTIRPGAMSAYISTDENKAILIDGGQDGPGQQDTESLVKKFLEQGIKHLQIVCSHPDKDHIQGLAEVVRGKSILQFESLTIVEDASIVGEKSLYKLFNKVHEGQLRDRLDYWPMGSNEPNGVKRFSEGQLEWRAIWAGENSVSPDPHEHAIVSVLIIRDPEDQNSQTIVYEFDDVTEAGRRRVHEQLKAALASANQNPTIILNMPHHGAATQRTDDIFELVKGMNNVVAVFSANSKNQYSHPSQSELMQAIKRLGLTKTYVTGFHGTIDITSKGVAREEKTAKHFKLFWEGLGNRLERGAGSTLMGKELALGFLQSEVSRSPKPKSKTSLTHEPLELEDAIRSIYHWFTDSPRQTSCALVKSENPDVGERTSFLIPVSSDFSGKVFAIANTKSLSEHSKIGDKYVCAMYSNMMQALAHELNLVYESRTHANLSDTRHVPPLIYLPSLIESGTWVSIGKSSQNFVVSKGDQKITSESFSYSWALALQSSGLTYSPSKLTEIDPYAPLIEQEDLSLLSALLHKLSLMPKMSGLKKLQFSSEIAQRGPKIFNDMSWKEWKLFCEEVAYLNSTPAFGKDGEAIKCIEDVVKLTIKIYHKKLLSELLIRNLYYPKEPLYLMSNSAYERAIQRRKFAHLDNALGKITRRGMRIRGR